MPQFQLNPSNGSLVIATERNMMDRRMDQDGQMNGRIKGQTGQKHILLLPGGRRHNKRPPPFCSRYKINSPPPLEAKYKTVEPPPPPSKSSLPAPP